MTSFNQILNSTDDGRPTPFGIFDSDLHFQEDADSLVRDLDGLIEKLNSTFQQDLREEQSRFTWYMSGGSEG